MLGDEKHLRAPRNGFGYGAGQSYATGGWGPNETFCGPGRAVLGESLNKHARELRDAVRRVRPFQNRALSFARHGDPATATAWRRCSTTPFSARSRMQPDGFSFYYSDYNNNGSKGLLPREVALLLGNVSAGHCRLRDQLATIRERTACT